MARLSDRRSKITIAVPVSTAGNFKDTQPTELLQIGGDQGEIGLRTRFKITKSDKKDPNTSQIDIYNLNDDHRAKLEQKNLKIQAEFGYKDSGLKTFFVGDVRICDHIREDANWVTQIHLGDGERAYRFARLTESFAPGYAASDIIEKLAIAMGLGLGNALEIGKKVDKVFDQGYAVVGKVERSLEKLLGAVGLEYSVQDGQLQLRHPGEALEDGDVPEIGPTSGLIGSPEMGTPEKKGGQALLKFKSLLVVTRPGRKVKIKSKRYNGFVVEKKLVFTGDTHGDEWYTEHEGVLLK